MRALGIDVGGSSVKIALLEGSTRTTSRSGSYVTPSRDQLVDVVRDAIRLLGEPIDEAIPVGLCLPGKRDELGSRVTQSLNLPCLEDWDIDDLLTRVLGFLPAHRRVLSDIQATAEDLVNHQGLGGRVAVLAIGTGVGMVLLEDGESLSIGGKGIGNLGQIDVGRCGEVDVFSVQDARNTLECYIGVRELRSRFGTCDDQALTQQLMDMSKEDPCLQALVRALRIVHAIYMPDTIVLAGGVGMLMSCHHDEIYWLVQDGLTTLAHPGWKLLFGDSLFHAAFGAARLALV